MVRNHARLCSVLACGSVLALASGLALGQSAPSFQLIDLGFEFDTTTLHFQRTPPPNGEANCSTSTGTMISMVETAVSPITFFIVGWAPTSEGTVHAAQCVFGHFEDLGVLYGGPNSYAENTSEYSPYVVGYSQTTLSAVPQDQGKTVTLAFVTSGNNNNVIKALLSAMNDPHYSSKANAVNDAGEAVGSGEMLFTSGPYSGQVGDRAMLWEPSGQVYNLQFYLTGSESVTLDNAALIDCHGNIAASGHVPGDTNPLDEKTYLLLRLNPIGSCPQGGPPQ